MESYVRGGKMVESRADEPDHEVESAGESLRRWRRVAATMEVGDGGLQWWTASGADDRVVSTCEERVDCSENDT